MGSSCLSNRAALAKAMLLDRQPLRTPQLRPVLCGLFQSSLAPAQVHAAFTGFIHPAQIMDKVVSDAAPTDA